MSRWLFLFLLIVILQPAALLGQSGFEQYYYLQDEKPVTFVPILHFQNEKNWYAEARYNYEELQSFSLYIGRNYTKEYKRLSYSLTPIVGAIVGRFTGGSSGINATLEFDDLFFYSQSQYTFAAKAPENDFMFSWSEVGYKPSSWFYFGYSLQHTHYRKSSINLLVNGMVIGFNAGKWTFPVYGFNLFNNQRYFVIGINLG
jgi:hypothetical protein